MFQIQKICKYQFKIYLESLFLIQIAYGVFTGTTPTPSAVAQDGQAPTVQMKPDLSFLVDPYYACFRMKDSSICKGFDFYIPNTGYYGSRDPSVPLSDHVTKFDAFVSSDITENTSYIMALCPDANIKHNTDYIAYRHSVYCGRLIYSQARWCQENDDFVRSNPQLSLCKSTCLEYANSIVDYGKNICQNADNKIAEQIRDNIIEEWCNLFSDEENCVKGVTSEVKNCGFLSASLSQEAQTFNPSNSCWKQQDKIEEIKNQAKEEGSKETKMGSIRWKVIYPIGVMITIALATIYFWRKQNEVYKHGVIEKKRESMIDYKILPSHAQPSRDYVDEEYIQSILKNPHQSLPRKKSTTLNKSDDNDKNIIRMVAIYNFHPKNPDELELTSGDLIRVEHQYSDGWGAGINETTNKFGVFPLICCSDNVSSNSTELPQRTKSSKAKATDTTVRSNDNSVTKRTIPYHFDSTVQRRTVNHY